ncbi:zinc finger protein 423 [Musca vetustissima]|uniref:zinc finger protein 423 n=1 Tax=Musca vetustissima TaxID=27455 RepID=UPI002AB61D56|nr:zinc finger protein 423 [Musca vetustissima]
MDELEPWNMFTSEQAADNAGEEENDDDADDDGGGGGDDENNDENVDDGEENVPFTIPSPVQDMQVKEEPPEPMEENFEDDSPFAFHSILHSDRDTPQHADESLFDFYADNSNSNRPPGRPPLQSTNEPPPPLSAEDEYYHKLVRYEDAIVYICPSCAAEFRSQDAWKTHLNNVHSYNTREGLNFIQLDKLYHECMECQKRIAMHSMENLMKHKFTHLPYRCCKCFICKRQYKYRQDLMVHLKMAHRDELIALAKEEHKNRPPPQQQQQNQNLRSILSKPSTASRSNISIGQVKESALDIFDNNSDGIEVRNEVLDEDDGDSSLQQPPSKRAARDISTFLDDGSTNGSAGGGGQLKSKLLDDIDESLEEYVLFTCPQCATECETRSEWHQHIEEAHDMASRKGLNIRDINQGQAQCIECNQTITNNTIRNLQLHKFTHLPHKKWLTCKLCFTEFDISKEVIRHLAEKHHLVSENTTNSNNDEDSQEPFGFGADDYNAKNSSSWGNGNSMSKSEERDTFEQHINYLCPQCGKEFTDKKLWRKHMVDQHQLGDLETLNFEVINELQLRCRECDKIITNAYGIQNAQQHRITHMQYKSFAICRICRKQYTERKGLTKHLRNAHGIGVPSSRNVNSASPIPNFGSPSTKPFKSKQQPPYKEIVRHNNYTYEICFLDEDDDVDFGGGGGSGSGGVDFMRDFGRKSYDYNKAETHSYNKRAYPLAKSNLEQMSRYRCVDCGSIFKNPQALQHHIKTEHDFVSEDKSIDVDDLLTPSSREPAVPSIADINTDDSGVDCNFIYICPECGVEFRMRHLWRRHINSEHNFDKRESLDFRMIDKLRFQCTICNEVVQSSKLKGLQDHKFRHCKYRQYLKCLLCGQAYNHKPNMISHLRQRHNIVEAEPAQHSIMAAEAKKQQIPAFNAPRQFYGGGSASKNVSDVTSSDRPSGLKTVEDVISYHNAVDHESIFYHCPSCTQTFDSHVFWRKHIVDEHNLNSRQGLNFRQLDDHHYICLQCYKRVTVTHTKGAIGQLQSHKFRHLPYKSFHCTVCKGEFVRKQMFFKHLDKITNKCDNSMNESTTNHSAAGTSAGKSVWPTRASLPAAAPSLTESTADNQGCFTLSCPQCGLQFESTRTWREHINIEHNLNSRNVLNFRKINSKLHLCLECNEHVNGRKLRDLQVHKFKHLPFGAYLHCRFCSMSYFHISNMQEHLKNKHPQMLTKMRADVNYEDDVTNLEGEDEDDGQTFGGGGGEEEEDDDVVVANDDDGGGDGDDVGDEDEDDDAPCPENMLDIDLLEAEAEIEEVDPDNVEADDQYLLG